MNKKLLFIIIPILLVLVSFSIIKTNDPLVGAWLIKEGAEEKLLIIKDGYFTYTVYNLPDKVFRMTTGGTYKNNGNLTITTEFDTENKDRIGQTETVEIAVNNNQLTIDYSD